MASVKEMRVRIAAVKSTQKITKAMQMVAAAKLRRAQSNAESARPYATKMASVIANIAGGMAPGAGPSGHAAYSRATRSMSASTIIRISVSRSVRACHPSLALALAGFPRRRSTSAGR